MTPRHGDGVTPEGFPPPGSASAPIRILVTLVPQDRSTELVEIEHTRNVRGVDVADILATVAEMLRADGPGACSTGIIFGGIKHEG